MADMLICISNFDSLIRMRKREVKCIAELTQVGYHRFVSGEKCGGDTSHFGQGLSTVTSITMTLAHRRVAISKSRSVDDTRERMSGVLADGIVEGNFFHPAVAFWFTGGLERSIHEERTKGSNILSDGFSEDLEVKRKNSFEVGAECIEVVAEVLQSCLCVLWRRYSLVSIHSSKCSVIQRCTVPIYAPIHWYGSTLDQPPAYLQE